MCWLGVGWLHWRYFMIFWYYVSLGDPPQSSTWYLKKKTYGRMGSLVLFINVLLLRFCLQIRLNIKLFRKSDSYYIFLPLFLIICFTLFTNCCSWNSNYIDGIFLPFFVLTFFVYKRITYLAEIESMKRNSSTKCHPNTAKCSSMSRSISLYLLTKLYFFLCKRAL